MQSPNHEKQDKEKAHKNMQHVHYYIKSDQLKNKKIFYKIQIYYIEVQPYYTKILGLE